MFARVCLSVYLSVSKITQKTRRRVELSCVAINGALAVFSVQRCITTESLVSHGSRCRPKMHSGQP